jgi:hypothetical protein
LLTADSSKVHKVLYLVLVFVSYEDFITLAIISGYLGFTRSFIQVPLPLVVAEYSVVRFPAAYGLSAVVGGVIGLSSGFLVGK